MVDIDRKGVIYTSDDRKVLYAEDEYANRRLIEYALRNAGVACDTANDGVEALALFQQNTYALVMLDQYMPGMNGSEVAAKIRQINPAIPLIGITSDDSQVPLLMDVGFDRVFLKPLRGSDYISAIIRYL